ncbi:hypothetical protein GCM10007385_39240 [Tateyamaria omphalii]|nr:hypothetical protein GCM10007385_39240 [Tateyamaria omphalii]
MEGIAARMTRLPLMSAIAQAESRLPRPGALPLETVLDAGQLMRMFPTKGGLSDDATICNTKLPKGRWLFKNMVPLALYPMFGRLLKTRPYGNPKTELVALSG